jgi:hypothetical protein
VTPWRIVLAVMVAALAFPVIGLAQGLGDVAARARQQREKTQANPAKAPVRSYTDADLPEHEESDDDEVADEADDEGDRSRAEERRPSRDASPSSEASRQEDLERARLRVQRLEAKVQELEARLNPMSTTYIYGGTGGPVGGSQADEERAVRRQLDATQRQLEEARSEATAAERSGRSARPTTPERDEPAGY